jgi:hypothetical protein
LAFLHLVVDLSGDPVFLLGVEGITLVEVQMGLEIVSFTVLAALEFCHVLSFEKCLASIVIIASLRKFIMIQVLRKLLEPISESNRRLFSVRPHLSNLNNLPFLSVLVLLNIPQAQSVANRGDK